MSERYKKLYDMDHRLYAAGAPVLIDGGALLQDLGSNALLCQLRIRNVQSRPIKGMRVVVQLQGAHGAPLGKPVDHRYSDLDLHREDELGRGAAIVLPGEPARAFRVRLSQVTFADGEVWTDEGLSWEPLPEQPRLEDYFEPGEAARLHRRLGEGGDYVAVQTPTLWLCSCGAANARDEARCHKCRRRRGALPLIGDAPAPEKDTDAEVETAAPGWRRLLPWGAGAIAVLALIAAVLFLLPGRIPAPQPAVESPAPTQAALAAPAPTDPLAESYERALALLDEGEYAEAMAVFADLGDYRDSSLRLAQIREHLQEQDKAQQYAEAKALLESGAYSQAREAFLTLGSYEDSAQLAKEAVYRKAVSLFAFIESHNVKGVTARLTVQSGQDSLICLPREKALELGSLGFSELQDACGKDPIRFTTEDGTEAELLPLEEAVAELFQSLDGYKDSADLAAALPDMMDRSDEFFALCAAGELERARSWLAAYTGVFEEREYWEQRLELCLPFCGDWKLISGDPGLVPAIGEGQGSWYSLHATVLLTPEGAVLRLEGEDPDAPAAELKCEPDETLFLLHLGRRSYLAEISAVGRLSIIKFNDSGVQGGVEYAPKDA